MRTTMLLRAALPAAAVALLLTACGPDETPGSSTTTAASAAPSAAATKGGGSPSADAPSAPASAKAPGGQGGGSGSGTYQSPLGANATGHSSDSHKLAITPVSVTKATAADVAPLHLDASDLAGRTPYFVTVEFVNESGSTIPDFGYNNERIWVHTAADDSGIINSNSTTYHVPQCQTPASAPAANGKGDRECGVYLVPNGQSPKFISYGAPMDTPIVWKVG